MSQVAREKPTDWGFILRRAARELKMGPSDLGRLTLTQLRAMLSAADPNDPHAGNTPIESEDDLKMLLGIA